MSDVRWVRVVLSGLEKDKAPSGHIEVGLVNGSEMSIGLDGELSRKLFDSGVAGELWYDAVVQAVDLV